MQCSRSCGGGNQFRDVTCLDNKGQVSKECHSKNKPYYYQRCNNTPCPTTAGNAPRRQNCRDTYTGNVCMYVVQANFCQFSSYRRMCCNSCARHWNEDQHCLFPVKHLLVRQMISYPQISQTDLLLAVEEITFTEWYYKEAYERKGFFV